MSANAQSMKKARFYAGLYMRIKNKIRFWGWSSPGFRRSKWKSPGSDEPERPWGALADWLRMAHSLAGTNSPEHIARSTQAHGEHCDCSGH